uniref:Uncharacterized protein n=1 Tax=Romanomermis culicivorax TaxID=13658 RepID=A0A915L477_ROMCU
MKDIVAYKCCMLKTLRLEKYDKKLTITVAALGVPEFRGDESFYTFRGCYYHGCPECFPDCSKKILNGLMSMEDAHQRTLDKI